MVYTKFSSKMFLAVPLPFFKMLFFNVFTSAELSQTPSKKFSPLLHISEVNLLL